MARPKVRAVNLAQDFIKPVLKEGGIAVDATAGNGFDTLFLAVGVGGKGKVYAFDIQQEALANTTRLLAEKHCLEQVTLICDGHEKMLDYIAEKVDAVMFNLGYLPGGDHKIITQPGTTIEALRAALNLLRPGGRLSLVVYTGHPGGIEELEAIEKELTVLPSQHFTIVRITFLNRLENAPQIFLIES